MNATIGLLAQLYGKSVSEIFEDVETAALRTSALVAQIRPDDVGGADRAEHFAQHCDAMRRQSLLLSSRLRASGGHDAT